MYCRLHRAPQQNFLHRTTSLDTIFIQPFFCHHFLRSCAGNCSAPLTEVRKNIVGYCNAFALEGENELQWRFGVSFHVNSAFFIGAGVGKIGCVYKDPLTFYVYFRLSWLLRYMIDYFQYYMTKLINFGWAAILCIHTFFEQSIAIFNGTNIRMLCIIAL